MAIVQGTSFSDQEWLTLQMGVMNVSMAIAKAGTSDSRQIDELVYLANEREYADAFQHALMRSMGKEFSQVLDALEAAQKPLGDILAEGKIILMGKWGVAAARDYVKFVVDTGRQIASAPDGKSIPTREALAVLYKLTQLIFSGPEWLGLQAALLLNVHAIASAERSISYEELRQLLDWEHEIRCDCWINAAILTSVTLELNEVHWDTLKTKLGDKSATILIVAKALLREAFDPSTEEQFVVFVVERCASAAIHANKGAKALRNVIYRMANTLKLCFSHDEWLTLQLAILRPQQLLLGEERPYTDREKEALKDPFRNMDDHYEPLIYTIIKSIAEEYPKIFPLAMADPRPVDTLFRDSSYCLAKKFGYKMSKHFLDMNLSIMLKLVLVPNHAGSSLDKLTRHSEWTLSAKSAFDFVVSCGFPSASPSGWLDAFGSAWQEDTKS